MKINISVIKATFYILALGSMAACTANYEDINKNPYEVTDKEMERDGYNISSALVSMQNWVVPTDVNTFQFVDCMMAGAWGGYFADSQPSFNAGKFSTFSAPDNWNKVMFTDIIPKVYSSYALLKSVTTDPVALAVGEVVRVASLHRITDAYGPIPYSKIGQDGELKAPYDSQKEVFTNMFAELTTAINVLTEHRTEMISANADKIFGGNVEKWIKFANSLKLRLAMRIVFADPTTAQKMAEEAVNHEVGVMTAVADNAALTSFGKDGNPYSKIMYEYNGGDTRISGDITAYMIGFKDPRCAVYFTKSAFTENDGDGSIVNDYIGIRSGINVSNLALAQKYSNSLVTSSTPLQWMNAAEVAFIKAEGALYKWNMGGDAKSFYEQGVALSFAQWNVSGAATYLANTTDTPQAYKDPLGIHTYAGTASSITVAWNDTATDEVNLERIITQKWIANFSLGNEAWADYRRTGYPKLMPVVVNNSVSTIVDSNKGARRLAYPLDEYTTNAKNVTTAVSQYLGGPDNMATNVWWDTKTK